MKPTDGAPGRAADASVASTSPLDATVAISTPSMWPEALAHLRARHAVGGRINYIGGPGDSITDGAGATRREHTWWFRFSQTMAARLGQGTRAIGSAEISVFSLWPVWKTSGTPPGRSGRGLGAHGMSLVPGTVVSTTQPCDRFRIVYDDTPEAFGLTGGTLEIRIDGRPVAAVDSSRSETMGKVWDSGPLGSFASRTVELECVAGDFVSLGHSYFHDGDGDDGALFWRNARGKFTSGLGIFGFRAEQATWAGCLTSRPVGLNPFTGEPLHGSGAIEPDCFLCCTGTNDIGLFDNDRTKIAEGYRSLIRHLRTLCGPDPSIGIIMPTASTNFGGRYGPLFEGIHDACTSEGAFLIDLWHSLGTHGDDSRGFYADGTHPNDRGHAAWAEYVSAWMLEAIGLPAAPAASAAPRSAAR